jgi:hypothetical protein
MRDRQIGSWDRSGPPALRHGPGRMRRRRPSARRHGAPWRSAGRPADPGHGPLGRHAGEPHRRGRSPPPCGRSRRRSWSRCRPGAAPCPRPPPRRPSDAGWLLPDRAAPPAPRCRRPAPGPAANPASRWPWRQTAAAHARSCGPLEPFPRPPDTWRRGPSEAPLAARQAARTRSSGAEAWPAP